MAQFTDPVLLSRERNRDEFSMTRSTRFCPRRESISSWKEDYSQPTPTTFGPAEFATKSPLEYEPQKAKNEPRTLPQAGDYGLNHRNSVETIETTEVTFAFRTSVGVDDFGASFRHHRNNRNFAGCRMVVPCTYRLTLRAKVVRAVRK